MILGICAVGLPVFVLSSASLTSTPHIEDFDGWAAVFTQEASSESRLWLGMEPVEAGAYGDHPDVVYTVAACGGHSFNAVLVLARDARLAVAGVPRRSERDPLFGGVRSVSLLPSLTKLVVRDTGSGTRSSWTALQVFRIHLPAEKCRVPFDPTADQPSFFAPVVTLRGPLRGHIQRRSFAPLGWHVVHSAQSWPLLGVADGSDPLSLGVFRFSSGLEGAWSRPFRSYFAIKVGTLDAKAAIESARPAVANTVDLSWTRTDPYRASARLTNLDNLGWWQSVALVAGVWFGIGSSILAALAYDWLRTPQDPPALQPSGAVTAPSPPSAGEPMASGRPRSALWRERAMVFVAGAAFVKWVQRMRTRR